MKQSHLIFNSSIAVQKPETIINRQHPCPFCDVESLTDILDQDGPIIWLKNKFPVLQDAFQTVIIETDECLSELSVYPIEHLERLLSFGIKHWLNMMDSEEYESVMFFKNHGPMSGGSLRHPHMQIVGLKNINAYEQVSRDQLEGLVIEERNSVQFNLSTKPRIGFFEFNVILSDLKDLPILAEYLQMAADYVLNHFHRSCTSYNLFFYYMDGDITVKLIPRFATSPIFIGYGIPQVSNKVSDHVQRIQEVYLAKNKLEETAE
jgi:ATP adenylyltransferase/5',5'''-P-1,P-4-tetraphosphate phosphorylase II